jgi:hypothetical protein
MLSCTATLRNTGNVRLSSITLVAPGGGSCTPDTPILLPNMTSSCTVSQAATQDNFENGGMTLAVTARATPSGTTPGQVTGEDSAAVTLPVRRQLVLTLARTSSVVIDRAGAVVQMTVTASNTGNIHLHNITLSMPDLGGLTCSSPLGSDLLVAGVSRECSGSFAFSQDALEAGSRNFTAGGSAANLGGPGPASNTVEVVVAASPSLQLDVDALNCTKPARMREYCHCFFFCVCAHWKALCTIWCFDERVSITAVACANMMLIMPLRLQEQPQRDAPLLKRSLCLLAFVVAFMQPAT